MKDQIKRTVSRETFERLESYADLVAKWSPAINLVARSTLDDLWGRHIADSVQVVRAAPEIGAWADLGSGGGFPGLVAAIFGEAQADVRPVTLVESDQRKCVFLQTAIRNLGLSATVLNGRIEDIPPLEAAVVSARALAPLHRLLGYCARHLAPDGTAVLPKGAQWQKELEIAQQQWRFSCQMIESDTAAGAVILKVRDIEHV